MPTVDDYVEIDGRLIRRDHLDQPVIKSQEYKGLTQSRKTTVISAGDLWDSPDEEIESLWGDFLFPESIHLLSGETGVGKTTFLYNLVIKARKAEEFVGIPFHKPLRTLYLDLETPSILRKRKLHVITDEKPDGIFFVPLVNCQNDSIELLGLIIDLKIDIVIVDTINEAFDTQKEDDNAEANRQMGVVRSIVNESGCSVILVHHIGKGESSKRVYKARGASARAASADVVLNLTGKSEDIICLETATNRWLGGINTLLLKKVGEDKFEAVVGDLGDLTTIEKYKAQQVIIEYLKGQKESQRQDIISALEMQGLKRSTADRALSDLFQLGKVRKPKRGFYSLPA